MEHNALTICRGPLKSTKDLITHLGKNLIWDKSRNSSTHSKLLTELAKGTQLSIQPLMAYGIIVYVSLSLLFPS